MSLRLSMQKTSLSTAAATSRLSIRCARCRVRSPISTQKPARLLAPAATRPFSASSIAFKKSGKNNRGKEKVDNNPRDDRASREAAAVEAFDFSDLESQILKAIEHLTHELSQLRAGGRFNPEKLEALKVTIQDGESKRTERVKDLAQVIAKGRNVQILAHDKSFVKPINSAILTSSLNLTPHGPTPDQPTKLTIQVPPPTGESRQKALEETKKAEEVALGKIREARGKHQKKLRAMAISETLRPDDLQKAQKLMDEVAKRGNEDVKKVVNDARKVLESA
ncbi:uncharacterized protein PV09_06568 [Verruconis gallopava]|uniref:Ribosome recycling factor domain-containing protein n=1 Tax=Verruconis gallopava TaxID=253628 RepID=A0A0D2A5S7_9PEZI|nr:uncharacterized protein PV09_06568 [Verruconis gallopava]KIW02073.1 hypothetical protein PV09_06568 [Verruconis gallopava]